MQREAFFDAAPTTFTGASKELNIDDMLRVWVNWNGVAAGSAVLQISWYHTGSRWEDLADADISTTTPTSSFEIPANAVRVRLNCSGLTLTNADDAQVHKDRL